MKKTLQKIPTNDNETVFAYGSHIVFDKPPKLSKTTRDAFKQYVASMRRLSKKFGIAHVEISYDDQIENLSHAFLSADFYTPIYRIDYPVGLAIAKVEYLMTKLGNKIAKGNFLIGGYY